MCSRPQSRRATVKLLGSAFVHLWCDSVIGMFLLAACPAVSVRVSRCTSQWREGVGRMARHAFHTLSKSTLSAVELWGGGWGLLVCLYPSPHLSHFLLNETHSSPPPPSQSHSPHPTPPNTHSPQSPRRQQKTWTVGVSVA